MGTGANGFHSCVSHHPGAARVSWAAMTLIANYKGIKRGDGDALRLAQRWSRYMAVTFAVGAVTGTVLSFELASRPQFMGKSRGVRRTFRVRGSVLLHRGHLHLDLYLRLATAQAMGPLLDWHPDPIAGIFGSASVIAANAWMNSPEGVTLDSSATSSTSTRSG